METSQIIDKYYDELANALRSAYTETLNRPDYQIQIYIWADGKIETLQGPAGDQSWLQSKNEERLYYIETVRGFDVFWELWDAFRQFWTDGSEPDEVTRKAFLAWLLDEYNEYDELDRIRDKWAQQEAVERNYSSH